MKHWLTVAQIPPHWKEALVIGYFLFATFFSISFVNFINFYCKNVSDFTVKHPYTHLPNRIHLGSSNVGCSFESKSERPAVTNDNVAFAHKKNSENEKGKEQTKKQKQPKMFSCGEAVLWMNADSARSPPVGWEWENTSTFHLWDRL